MSYTRLVRADSLRVGDYVLSGGSSTGIAGNGGEVTLITSIGRLPNGVNILDVSLYRGDDRGEILTLWADDLIRVERAG